MAGALFGALFMFAPHFALAADLTLSPGTGSVAVGAKLSVKVTIVPGTDSVNAADATIALSIVFPKTARCFHCGQPTLRLITLRAP
jgi:hypothetical protein